MSGYGYQIVQTLIVDIEPDERVKRSMNEINAGIYISITLLSFFSFFIGEKLHSNEEKNCIPQAPRKYFTSLAIKTIRITRFKMEEDAVLFGILNRIGRQFSLPTKIQETR